MTKLLPLALHAACATAVAFFASAATAQTSPPGRTAFDQNGCRSCHAYSSRRGAPSVRDMLSSFEGEPENALDAIEKTERHTDDPLTKKMPESDRRIIAEWLAGTEFPAPELAIADAPATPAAPPVIAPLVAPVPPPEVEPYLPISQPIYVVRASSGHLIGLVIEPGKKADRLIVHLSGRNPDDLDLQNVDGKLIIRLPGIRRAPSVPETMNAAKAARFVSSIKSIDENGTLVLTVLPRSGEIKYSATHGRNRLAIDLSTVPSKKKPAPVVIATAPAPAKPSASAPAPALKAATDKTAASSKPAPLDKIKPPAVTVDEAKAKKEADTLAKARQDAENQAKAKREQEAAATELAIKKAAAEKAPLTATSSTPQAEVDMLAALRASAEALKSGGASDTTGTPRAERKERGKGKAPAKYRDEPCPPLAASDPIGVVDEARAKDIIERIGCPQCHAFVQKKTGPPFKRVFEKVKGNPSCVVLRLKKNKEHNDEGITADLKLDEFKIVADYLATRAK